MQNALQVIREVHAAWGERFGRYHAPLVEEYRLDDADYALVTIGSMTGAAKDAIDIARSEGEAVGLIKIKTFRPFPLQAMVAALAKVKRIGVVDRSVSFGWNCGPVYQETLAALHHTGKSIPAISFHRRSCRCRHHCRAFRSRYRLNARDRMGPPPQRAGLAE